MRVWFIIHDQNKQGCVSKMMLMLSIPFFKLFFLKLSAKGLFKDLCNLDCNVIFYQIGHHEGSHISRGPICGLSLRI